MYLIGYEQSPRKRTNNFSVQLLEGGPIVSYSNLFILYKTDSDKDDLNCGYPRAKMSWNTLFDSFTLNYTTFPWILKYESHNLGLPAEHIFIVNVENVASNEWLNSTHGKDKSEIVLKSPIIFLDPSIMLIYTFTC